MKIIEMLKSGNEDLIANAIVNKIFLDCGFSGCPCFDFCKADKGDKGCKNNILKWLKEDE